MTQSNLDRYRLMRRIRVAEEQLAALKKKGAIPGSVHLCNGQEAIPVGAVEHLRSDDFVTATYRGHGWAIARGIDLAAFFAEIMGRDSSLSGGRAGSPYLTDPKHNLLGENSIVGAGVPIAAGAALTAQRTGSDRVSIVSIGDGAMNQGAVHETLNLAAVLALPLVLIIENNGYSEMSRIEDMILSQRLSDRAAGYGIPAARIDGNDPQEVSAAVSDAIARARSGGGPTVVEALTARLVGHYSGDVQHYRPQGEVAEASRHEPLRRIRDAAAGDPDALARLDQIDREIDGEIEAAIVAAEATPYPDPTTAQEHVYA